MWLVYMKRSYDCMLETGRSYLQAAEVLAQGRRERGRTDLWTSPPNIFLFLKAPLARWKCSPFWSGRKKSAVFRSFGQSKVYMTKTNTARLNLLVVLLHFLLDGLFHPFLILLFLYNAFTNAIRNAWTAGGLLTPVNIRTEESKTHSNLVSFATDKNNRKKTQ